MRGFGPNHLGLWYDALPEQQMALITSGCMDLCSVFAWYADPNGSQRNPTSAFLTIQLGCADFSSSTLEGDVARVSMMDDNGQKYSFDVSMSMDDVPGGGSVTDQWVHLALAVSEDKITAYVDGQDVNARWGRSKLGFSTRRVPEVDRGLCTGGSALTGAGSDAAIAAVAGATAGSIADIVAASENHETLLAAVTAAGLVDTFAGEGSFTLFAPTDAAFAALPDGTVEALLADIPALTAILTYHALGAAVVSSDLSDGLMATTLQGTDIAVRITRERGFPQTFITAAGSEAQVMFADNYATNGVVHIISAVLLPPVCECSTDPQLHDGSDGEGGKTRKLPHCAASFELDGCAVLWRTKQGGAG